MDFNVLSDTLTLKQIKVPVIQSATGQATGFSSIVRCTMHKQACVLMPNMLSQDLEQRKLKVLEILIFCVNTITEKRDVLCTLSEAAVSKRAAYFVISCRQVVAGELIHLQLCSDRKHMLPHSIIPTLGTFCRIGKVQEHDHFGVKLYITNV